MLVPAAEAAIDPAALLRYLAEDCRVAKQKLPERMVVVDALPINATGKVVKFELVELLQARSG